MSVCIRRVGATSLHLRLTATSLPQVVHALVLCGGGALELLAQNVRNSVVPAFARACPSVAACSVASCTQKYFAVRRVLKRHFVASLPCLCACLFCWACLLGTNCDLQRVEVCKCMVCKSMNIHKSKSTFIALKNTSHQDRQNR